MKRFIWEIDIILLYKILREKRRYVTLEPGSDI